MCTPDRHICDACDLDLGQVWAWAAIRKLMELADDAKNGNNDAEKLIGKVYTLLGLDDA